MKRTYNPCDECPYSYSRTGEESNTCKICELRYFIELAPKTGTWIKAECSEKNGDSNCSVCGHFDWSDCNYCSSCGSKNRRI